jgi:S1-C subfamily serine protease
VLSWARALCLVAGCLWLPAWGAAAQSLNLQRLAESVFRVEARDDAGRVHSGSAVMVAPHNLVTNCHTIANAQTITVTGVSGSVLAHLVRAHAERDLCLLSAPRLNGAVVALGSTEDKRAGEHIVAVGYPAGATLTVSSGHIEGLFTHQGNGRVIQGSAYFSAGKSGGGLFDRRGSLIGILTFKCRAGGPYHFAVPAEWVQSLVHDDPRSTAAFNGAPFWRHTDERQPMFLRAAALSATGDCGALSALAERWLEREPGNPDALFVAKRAERCAMLALIQRPHLEK